MKAATLRGGPKLNVTSGGAPAMAKLAVGMGKGI